MIKDSSHWYDLNGTAVHSLPNKSKPGATRPTTIKDARALGLLPSVTTVLNVLAKPALDTWKLEQVAAAAHRRPPRVGEGADAYAEVIIDAAFDQVTDAADLGTDIHSALEAHFQGRTYAPEMEPYVKAVETWAKNNGVEFLQHELRMVSRHHGYAGTTDAVVKTPKGTGILDFKSRKTKPGYPATPYDTQPMQIAAYHIAKFKEVTSEHVGVNVFISTTEPGRIDATWYEPNQLWDEWYAFQATLHLWRHLRGYDPRG
jgi:hypothetical protein